MAEQKEFKPGLYRHFKGGEYKGLFKAKDTETEEDMIVYESTEDGSVWVRPAAIFMEAMEAVEVVEAEGGKMERFQFLSEIEDKDFEDKYLRALADYQNLLKRTAQEKSEFAKYANEQLVLEIIPVYDNLKTALKHAGEAPNEARGVIDGVGYVIKQFADALRNYGVEEIRTEGNKFDHNSMEAMEKEATDDEAKDGIVARELTAGYKMGDKVIKAARVAVYEVCKVESL